MVTHTRLSESIQSFKHAPEKFPGKPKHDFLQLFNTSGHQFTVSGQTKLKISLAKSMHA